MTRTILLVVVLFFSNIALAKPNAQEEQETQETQETQEISIELIKANIAKIMEPSPWERFFYQSLIEDDDANIKLLGYSKILSRSNGLDDINSLQDIAIEINSMLASQTLSHKSIAIIDNLCLDARLEPFCNHEALLAKQNQSMPDNAYIYLQRFNLAYEDNNQGEISQLIKNMASSNYIDIFMYLDEGFRIKLEEHVKAHPFPKITLDINEQQINRFPRLNPKESEEVSDNIEDIIIFTKVASAKLTEPLPSFMNLKEECKNNAALEQSCLEISELFINKSKSIITALIGHSIKIESLKQQGNSKELEQAEASKVEYRNHYECLANIAHYGSPYFSKRGVEFSKLADSIEREFGEVAYWESLAKSNYDYYVGDKNINNPENCNEKIVD